MRSVLALTVSLSCLCTGVGARSASAQGIMLSAVGPVNRSMGGAATAAPLESAGSLFWNPASITALPSSELSVGMALALPVNETTSSIAGFAAGASDAEPGVIPLPNIGWVHQLEDSRWTTGVGVFAAAGLKTNFAASATNPVFFPQSNTPGLPGGLGGLYAEANFLEIIPTLAYELSDNVSVGVGPTITIGEVILDPLVAQPPNDADGSGAFRYSSGRATRNHWGGGFQVGGYYENDNGWHLGATFKSPQWMEEFRYHTQDELGLPTEGRAKIDLPMIVSLGLAYSGWDRIVLATDLRYYDYDNADGFGAAGFNPDGSLAGLGWKSVFGLASGVQFEVTEDFYLRCGYTYNRNPIPERYSFFNIGSPLYFQHQVHIGGSWRIAEPLWFNIAYSYYPHAEISGPILTPAGAIPGSNVTNREEAHFLDLGLVLRY